MSSRTGTRRSRTGSRSSRTSTAADARYDAMHSKMKSSETRLQSTIGENETLKRDNTRLRKLQRDRVNLNVLDDEAGASDAKVIALQNLHSQKVRALMKSIEKYKIEVKKLSSQNRESSRSRQIQGLQNQLRGAELVADVLKEKLTTSNTPMSPEDVNNMVITKTLGGPKRFRPQTREELQNQVQDLELKYKRAFANGEKTKQRLRDSQRENSNQRLNSSSSVQEGKMSQSNSRASYGSKHEEGKSNTDDILLKPDHSARVVELLGQLEEMRAQTEVKDRQIRMYVSKVEGLHESKRESMGYKDKYERSKLKNQQQLDEIETMHQEEIKLRRAFSKSKETALRLEAEVDVQKEEGMVNNQDVGRQRLKDMQKISELTEDLSELRSKLDRAEKGQAIAHQKRLKGTQTLESTMTSLKSKMLKMDTENTDLRTENIRLQQRLDREIDESKRTLASTTSSTQGKITEQARHIKKITSERDEAQKEMVRHETAAKNHKSQLDRTERANKDRTDKLESLLQSKETEIREMEKIKSDIEYKSQDARRTAKEIESRGETGMKAMSEELEDVRAHLKEETNARQTMEKTCASLQKALNSAKTKIRKLQKQIDSLKVARAGQKRSGGPAASTPAKVEKVEQVEDEEDSDDDDLDSIMNA